MSQTWSPQSEPVWGWLAEDWNYPVPEKSIAATNLDALRGKPITEVMRWEEEEWEMFAGAGPDITDAHQGSIGWREDRRKNGDV